MPEADLLIFASKAGGITLTEYLLSINAPVKMIIVANHNDRKLIELIESAGIQYVVYAPYVQQILASRKERYGWLLNLWSPHILKPSVLALANRRLNVHPSMAPYCRGNDNAAWTLRENVPAGVSLMEMGEKIDDGDIYIQKEVAYSFPIRGKELNIQLLNEANNLFIENWPAIYAGNILPYPQQGLASYHRRKETEQDRIKDFSEVSTIGDCLKWILAHDFSPGTTSEVIHGGKRFKATVSLEEF